jgi:hypothetical protein
VGVGNRKLRLDVTSRVGGKRTWSYARCISLRRANSGPTMASCSQVDKGTSPEGEVSKPLKTRLGYKGEMHQKRLKDSFPMVKTAAKMERPADE